MVGAGIGGLTAAALLAKTGLRVCVLEMDTRPGGYLAGFTRGDFVFDTAIHWLNQCGPGGIVKRIFDLIAPGAPTAPPLRRIRRYRGDSFDYLLTSEPDRLRGELVAAHPEQRAGLDRFFSAARGIGDAFVELSRRLRARETMGALEKVAYGAAMAKVGLAFARYVTMTTEDAARRHFAAPILERVYCSEARVLSCLTPVGWAYHGDYQVPPAGGSREFPRFLARACQDRGGRVFYKARVDRILLAGRRVAGVEVTVGRRAPERRTIRCRYVLAACDLETLYERMLPPGTIDADLCRRIREADLYDSTVTLSMGLDVPPAELGLGEELVLLSRDDVSRTDHNAGDPHKAAISVLAPSLRDPTLAPSGKGTLTCYTTANIGYGDRWQTGANYERGPAYTAFKRAYADVILDRVSSALRIDLRRHIEICEIATPVTHRRYTGNRDGTIMAAKPTRENYRNKVAHYLTPVENLYLAGHWAEYGGGIPVAVRAGANSAMLVMRRERPVAFRTVADVIDHRREIDEVDPADLTG